MERLVSIVLPPDEALMEKIAHTLSDYIEDISNLQCKKQGDYGLIEFRLPLRVESVLALSATEHNPEQPGSGTMPTFSTFDRDEEEVPVFNLLDYLTDVDPEFCFVYDYAFAKFSRKHGPTWQTFTFCDVATIITKAVENNTYGQE